MIKAVIFDLDGVLVDSEPFSGEASSKALREFGIELTPEERTRAFGRTDLDIASYAIKLRGLDLNPRELVKRKDAVYSEIIKGKLRPMPHTRELIELLRSKGIPFALASSGTPGKIRATLSEIGFEDIFDTIVSGEDISRGKPHPEIFLKAAEKLGMEPGDCLVVEDAQAGIEAAKAAGMRCIALRSPSTYGQDFSKADRIIDSLEELEGEL
jgi:beta-phosphoglucomutase family hydrolase